jgi:hypothetical protein
MIFLTQQQELTTTSASADYRVHTWHLIMERHMDLVLPSLAHCCTAHVHAVQREMSSSPICGAQKGCAPSQRRIKKAQWIQARKSTKCRAPTGVWTSHRRTTGCCTSLTTSFALQVVRKTPALPGAKAQVDSIGNTHKTHTNSVHSNCCACLLCRVTKPACNMPLHVALHKLHWPAWPYPCKLTMRTAM